MTRQSWVEITSDNDFAPSDMDDFCDLAEKMIKSSDYSNTICSTLRFFARLTKLDRQTEGNEAVHEGGGRKVSVLEEEVLQVEQTQLLYTWPCGPKQRHLRSKRLNNRSALKQARSFGGKGRRSRKCKKPLTMAPT